MGAMAAMESPLAPDAQASQGGQAPDLPADFAPELPREARYLRHALFEAMRDAAIDRKLPCPPERCGILLGTTLHGMRSAGRMLRSNDYGVLKDFLASSVLYNAAAGLDLRGCVATVCSACSSSLGSIAMAVSLLRSGEIDLVIAGGYDTISEYVYSGFASLRLVAAEPLRPFARDRQGMKLAEGYGIVVLERREDAIRRGAPALAEILGYGESADAHHLTQPHPQGAGAAAAMRQAITDSGLSSGDIDLIAAHATGTPDNDASEFAAMRCVFGERLRDIPVVAFKSHLGHTLGGAGAVELVLSAMAMAEQVIPPCANVTPKDIEFAGLALSHSAPRPAPIRATLNTSLGFGGANTCMVLGPANSTVSHNALVPSRPAAEVFISGIGVLIPGAVGNEAFVNRILSCRMVPAEDPGSVADCEIAELLTARRVRRMSPYVKLSLAATVLALRDAGVREDPAFLESCGVVLGTTHGSANYSEAYYRQIVTEGIAAANPMLFAEGVPNAAAAHLSLMLSLKGPCQTVIGSRTAGLDALRLAAARIAAGEWSRAIVGAAEEYSPVVNEAYRRWGLYGNEGFRASSGAVTLILESARSLESRSATPRGQVLNAVGGAKGCGPVARIARRVVEQLGRPPILLTSDNCTWIGRAEAIGAARRSAMTFRPYGQVAECFSVLPLAGIAAILLCGALPTRLADGSLHSDGISQADEFGVISTDYSGLVSGARIKLLRQAFSGRLVAPPVRL